MCTHIVIKNNTSLMAARTMDFSFPLQPTMYVMPRNYPIEYISKGLKLEKHKAFLGLGQNINGHVFADGINEYGLSCAALYFEGYAKYNTEEVNGKVNLAPHEIVSYILASCKDTEDVQKVFQNINLVAHDLALVGAVTPLHWVVVDSSGKSIVIEPMEDGVSIKENAIGVVTNSPNLEWQLTNLRNYISLSPNADNNLKIDDLELKPFGQGSGSFGLPGDYTPPSRFIRAAYNKFTVEKGKTEKDLVKTAYHILNTVSVPKGAVITNSKQIDYTQYTTYMSLLTKTYYFKTYDNINVMSINLMDYNLDKDSITDIQVDHQTNFSAI